MEKLMASRYVAYAQLKDKTRSVFDFVETPKEQKWTNISNITCNECHSTGNVWIYKVDGNYDWDCQKCGMTKFKWDRGASYQCANCDRRFHSTGVDYLCTACRAVERYFSPSEAHS